MTTETRDEKGFKMTTADMSHLHNRTGEQHNRGDGGKLATFGDVKEDVAQLRQDVTEYAAHTAETGIEAVTNTATRVAETGKKAADVAKETHGKMCEYVSAHPTMSVLIAAGVGALLARVMPRR